MTTQTQIDNLIRLYLRARNRLLNVIVTYPGVGTKTYANTILRQVQTELERLQAASDKFADVAIQAEYQKNLDDMYDYFTKTGLNMSKSFMFAQVHHDAVYVIGREMQYQIRQGLATVGRQIQRYVDTSRDEALRQIGLTAAGEKLASAGTIGAMKRNMVNLLQRNGFMTIQYGDAPGRQVPIDVYARMVARSTAREAANTARLNTMDQLGYDLVHVSEHSPTCEICAAHQGRVYSVSGKDKRFPYLYAQPGFEDGYRNFHPNCRHVITPTVEALWTPEQRAKYLGTENKPADKDTRTKRQVKRYNEKQGENRKARDELYEYEQYKMTLGPDAPDTFADFKRLKAAGGDAWDNINRRFELKNTLNRVPFRPAATIQEAKDYAKNTLGITARFDDFNLDVANMVNYETTKAKAIFGDITKLKSIEKFPTGIKRSNAVGMYHPAYDTLYMRNVSTKNALSGFGKQAALQKKIGHWSTPDKEHVIRHEVGHAVEYSLRSGSNFMSQINNMRTKLQNDVLATKLGTDEYAKYLSKYGMTNTQEFIAESIAEFLTGSPRKLAFDVVTTILKAIGR